MKKNKKRRIFIIVFAGLLLLLFVLPFVGSIIAYESFFGVRYTTDSTRRFSQEEFEGLEYTRYTFPSDKGQTLVGYYYRADGVEPHGILVFAHGLGGGGHNTYLDCISFFARNGYPVFAFDATGNDESEGNGVNGLSQGVIDLSCAIDFVEKSVEIPDLPIVLWGHSWGGYCVSAVLAYHPEVKAVVAVSGFDRSSDLIQAQGEEMLGGISILLVPYAKLYERIKLGKWAGSTATEGFESSDARVMVVHGSKDTVVPLAFGYTLWKDKYADDPRFTFILRENRGHGNVYYSQEYLDYSEAINRDFQKWAESLDYDYTAKENRERFNEEIDARRREKVDRNILRNRIDETLFAQMLSFYDDSIQN